MYSMATPTIFTYYYIYNAHITTVGTQHAHTWCIHYMYTYIVLRHCENTVRFCILRPPLLFFNVPKTIQECLRGWGRFLMLRKNCPKQPLAHCTAITVPPPSLLPPPGQRNSPLNDGLSFGRYDSESYPKTAADIIIHLCNSGDTNSSEIVSRSNLQKPIFVFFSCVDNSNSTILQTMVYA